MPSGSPGARSEAAITATFQRGGAAPRTRQPAVAAVTGADTRAVAALVAALSREPGAPPAKILRQMAEAARSSTRNCCGATAATWEGQENTLCAATHPGLAALFDVQLRAGDGPMQAALRAGEPAYSPDTLTERRWPAYTSAALAYGVRWSAVLLSQPHGPGYSVTLTLHGVRARLPGPGQLGVAGLITAAGAAALTRAADLDAAQRSAAQFRQAISARAQVDQAKGIIMHTVGCTADEALDMMRHISQTRHVKVTELASAVLHDLAGNRDPGVLTAPRQRGRP